MGMHICVIYVHTKSIAFGWWFSDSIHNRTDSHRTTRNKPRCKLPATNMRRRGHPRAASKNGAVQEIGSCWCLRWFSRRCGGLEARWAGDLIGRNLQQRSCCNLPRTFFPSDFYNMSLVALKLLQQEPCYKLFQNIFSSDTLLQNFFWTIFSFNLCNRSFVTESLLHAKYFPAAEGEHDH